jgi:hypothetical protein
MSLYENKISEQVDKLLPTNDYINALTKAILKNDEEYYPRYRCKLNII